MGVGADAAQTGLPKGYTRMVNDSGEIVVQGPRRGIYTATDNIDIAGNPLYANSGKLYSLDGKKASVLKRDAANAGVYSDILPGYGAVIKMDGHKIYDPNFQALGSNSAAQYRFSDPSFRATGGDIYLGENVATAYYEVQKNISGKSLFVGDIRVDNMLDLTDTGVLKNMRIDSKKLTAVVDNPLQKKTVYSYTNKISNEAYRMGYNGIIFPSSRKRGANKAVVLFDGRYNPQAIKMIIDKQIN